MGVRFTPASLNNMKFDIYKNIDGTEWLLCSHIKPGTDDFLTKDVDGNPMTKVKVFTADTWEEAKEQYELEMEKLKYAGK